MNFAPVGTGGSSSRLDKTKVATRLNKSVFQTPLAIMSVRQIRSILSDFDFDRHKISKNATGGIFPLLTCVCDLGV
jgi:hypothetical protein